MTKPEMTLGGDYEAAAINVFDMTREGTWPRNHPHYCAMLDGAENRRTETPLFVKVGGKQHGPFLYRGNRLMPITMRAAYALLIKGWQESFGDYAPMRTFSQQGGVTVEVVYGMSDVVLLNANLRLK